MRKTSLPEQSLTFSKSAFSVESIKRAAYVFSDKFTISLTDHQNIVCKIEFLSSFGQDEIDLIIRQFKTEVLDQDLREKIRQETAEVRNVILAHAFSKTGLQSDE